MECCCFVKYFLYYFLFPLTRPLFKTWSYIFTCKIGNIAYNYDAPLSQSNYILFFCANDKI